MEPEIVDFFFYFGKKKWAEEFIDWFGNFFGFTIISLHEVDDKPRKPKWWLQVAKYVDQTELDVLNEMLPNYVKDCHGKYDGYGRLAD